MTKAGFRSGGKMDRWRDNLRNPHKALKQIGIVMVAESHMAFRHQKHGNTVWPPRGKVNVFGVIADVASGRNPPNRRFKTTPALIDTGRLRDSIAYRVSGNSVIVGSNLEYADKHHRGLETESEQITEEAQVRLAEWLSKQGSRRKKQLGWLLNPSLRDTKLKMKLPKRPIVGITRQTREDVRELIGVHVFEV